MELHTGRPLPAGTAAEAVVRLARRAARLDIALHTVEVSVGGELVVSAASAPLGPHVPQRMYSVSKTVTGLAVGLLAAEGVLDLDDPVIRHFPEMAPVHPWLEATTIRHLLAMRGPHRATTYEPASAGWLTSYFRVPPTHPPGTLFTYDTSATYTLSALVERLAGASLADYLRPRLLDPIGADAGLRFLTGPEGIAHGGSGLICTPRDLLRLAHLLLGTGVPVIPADYLRDATRRQADTTQLTWGRTLRGGYGYQLWLPPAGGWLMFGLGGQIVYGDPVRSLAVVVTADAQACGNGDHRLLDDVMDLLVAPLAEETDETGARTGDRAASPPGAPGAVVGLEWPAPRHDASALSPPLDGVHRNVADGPGPAELCVTTDDDGGRVRAFARGARHGASPTRDGDRLPRGTGDGSAGSEGDAPGWEIEFRFGRPVATRIGGKPAVVTAGRPEVGILDLRCAIHGDDLATWRLRLARSPDGTVAVQAAAYGESVDPSWTFHAAYVPVRVPARGLTPCP
ncbi:serine hydrolase domain-containing protein [Myceligenerans salitolerans]|uniref:Beta-lactamase family protein n=1 Tax=Myceligenerans salitolerans TaxID=1230528 RepID=A0ABS3I8P9_9MICO|nr:serine hydrolase domain-containing protein [Myceligenerans salitolerans]MBO0609402.1 beta-lactamase family protein [Myceligenerans salitolerans]